MVERTLPLPNSISESVLHGETRRSGARRTSRRRRRPKRKGTRRSWFAFSASWSVSASSSSPPGRCSGASIAYVERAAERDRRASLPPASRATSPYSFDGPFGRYDRQQLQRGFQVYQGGLRRLPRPATSSRSATSTISAIARPRCARSPTSGRSRCPSVDPETGEARDPQGAAGRPLPEPLCQRGRRARRQQQCAAARSVADRQGARGRPGLCRLAADRLPATRRPTCRAENRPGTGLHYNPYFANLNIAMPPPLTADGQVTYADGTAGDPRADGARTSPPS